MSSEEHKECGGVTTTVVLGEDRPVSGDDEGGCLVQIFGEGLGTRYELRSGMTRFGRDDDNDVILQVESVSRQHCDFTVGDGIVAVRDLGSTNGIDYKGMRIDNKRIDEGDVFHLCDYELRFTYRD